MVPKKGTTLPLPHLRRCDPDPVFGNRVPLSNKLLPLVREVGQALAYEAEEERFRSDTKKINCDFASEVVSKQLVALYEKAGLPTIDSPREAIPSRGIKGRVGCRGEIKKKVKRLWDLRRSATQSKSQKNFKGKRRCKGKNNQVKENWDDIKDKLFEIADNDEFIPKEEFPFLKDQRSERQMEIGKLDKEANETAAYQREKRDKVIRSVEKEKKRVKIDDKAELEDSEEEKESKNGDYDSDFEYKIRVNRRTREELRKDRLSEEAILETADRFNMTDSAVAHLANEIRAADGEITEENQEKVSYPGKVRKARVRVRKRKVGEMEGKKIFGIMFDERIDKTRICVGEGEKQHKRFKVSKEEHCAVVGFGPDLPGGSSFLGHLSPTLGTGKGLAQDVAKFTDERVITLLSPPTFLTDGCAKMGGYKGGAHAQLEEIRGERAQRVFCVSHMIERPWARLFEHYDGKTTGPESWSGEIGKVIVTDVWNLPVIDFEPLPNPELLQLIEAMPSVVLKKLKHDYIYLIEMGRGLMSGKLSEKWAKMQAGTCSTVRWTNPQSRTARLYMSTQNPSFNMRRLCNLLVYVYIPTLVDIKMKNTLPHGPHHFLKLVKMVDLHCLQEEKESLQPILQFNAYQAHPECVLLGMLASKDVDERKRGVEEILRIRKLKIYKPRGNKKIRKFKVPPLNFTAKTLETLTDLTINRLEPPLTSSMSEGEIKAFIETPFSSTMPCSTTEVERAVQIVTQAAKMSADPILRDGAAFNKIAARGRNQLKDKKIWKLKNN